MRDFCTARLGETARFSGQWTEDVRGTLGLRAV